MEEAEPLEFPFEKQVTSLEKKDIDLTACSIFIILICV